MFFFHQHSPFDLAVRQSVFRGCRVWSCCGVSPCRAFAPLTLFGRTNKVTPLRSDWVLLSQSSSLLWASPTPPPSILSHFTRSWLIRSVTLGSPNDSARSPVPQSTFSTFRALYTGGFFGAASPSSLHAFPGLRLRPAGLDSLLAHLREYTLTMRQASLNVADC
jgi:hypothetical protein